MALYEVLEMDDDMRDLVLQGLQRLSSRSRRSGAVWTRSAEPG